MSAPTERQAAEALRAAPPIILAPGPKEPPTRLPPPPDEKWSLPGGTAWVYYGDGNSALTRPVIVSDGFNTGPSSLEFSWTHLEFGDYPFISELRRRGRDFILLGFDERSASILENAEAAIAAIRETVARCDGPLAVGGFSMGGLVTRYALAKLEKEDRDFDHQTAVYWSYDSPHRGAYIPISLQAFAHYIAPLDPRFSEQMNSSASRELLWRHIEHWQDKPGVDKQRADFLAKLAGVGDWPRVPRLIGVANGVGSGTGNGIESGATAVLGTGESVTGTTLRTQPTGDDSLVATLRVVTEERHEAHAPGLPAVDGAPGGTLEGFGILADALNQIPALAVENPTRSHCFVPAVSAVALRDLDSDDALYGEIDPSSADSELHEFKLSSRNQEHGKVTEELCTWLLERLP
ncbi:hypothetical protein [Streptomyces sp. NRRL S-350]|uniref:hypothetical protein n=1 Tax=Streptomyces sp. NRRL S-350 TaxID=1463902 RepID=UPI0004C05A0E|nr:hypothetical protein [Streptomyces sp. NRRL S-350]